MLAPVAVVLASGALAVFGAERNRPWLVWILKPLTTLLLLTVVGLPRTALGRSVDAGILLSVVGDVALLAPGNRAFLAGLAAFLLAHLAYVAAFARLAVWSPAVAAVAVVALAATGLVLRAIWKGAVGLHAPTVAYGLVISAMVVTASATLGSGLPGAPLAVGGAVLFYASDASLALNRFRRPIPHAAVWTMGLYWLGQLGIALGARGG